MKTDKHELKARLRSKIRETLKNLPSKKRKSDSEKLCARLKVQSFFQSAISVLFFAPLGDEADLWPLLEESLAAKKMIVLPRFDPTNRSYFPCRVNDSQNEIIPGQFGIREPSPNCAAISLNEIDLVLIPGVAFDRRGNRLGRGQGFYDRLLKNFRGNKVGVVFDEQIEDAVPAGKTDVKMDFIVTPTRCIEVGR